MLFSQKLAAAVTKNNSLLCVGLDADLAKLPPEISKSKDPLFSFNKAIIDATADLVCGFKSNSAFYEGLGADGIRQLELTTTYIKKTYPHLLNILDAKRADIGNTNEGYIDYVYEYLSADAITLHPYLGHEALEPFLKLKDKGSIILCRTSNPGASEFQDLKVDGQPLYQRIAKAVAENWNINSNCALVVGATYPKEMKIIRELVGDNLPFLVPGVGAQGGDIEQVVRSGLDSQGSGLIINSARDIIYASSGRDFADAARAKAKLTRDTINRYR